MRYRSAARVGVEQESKTVCGTGANIVVYLASMKSVAESLERGARRYAKNTDAAAREALRKGSTHERLCWGLASIPGGAYTLRKRHGRACAATLPGDLCDLLGLKVGSRIVYVLNEAGHVEILPATLEDLPEVARAAAALADQMLATQQQRPLLKHFEKVCERCNRPYCARSSSKRFCPTCGLLRARESDRRHWHRRGKLCPSYARKLKGRRSTAAELATPRAAGNTDGATHGALVLV